MIGFKRKLMVDLLTASLGFTGASQSALFDRGGDLCRIQDHQVSLCNTFALFQRPSLIAFAIRT